jgi:hypothetical protein
MTLRGSRSLFSLRLLTVALPVAAALTLAAPQALAQGAPKPAAKPAGKADPKKAADDTKAADDAKAADQKKADDAKAAEEADAAKKKAEDGKPAVGPSSVEPPHEAWDITDVTEVDGKKYFFIGARYRGNIIPQFMLNLFVDEGATFYSNNIAIEFDMRKDGFSLIPAIGFTEYGTGGDVLFKEKGKPSDFAGNYSFVNSSMKAVYFTADLLWSAKINKNFDFEYGAGFGLGVVFGDLANNWVQEDPAGPLSGSNGKHYSKCLAEGAPKTGCNKADHQQATTAKVGNYTEDSWFSGGSKPVVFPWISIPQVGLRYKPVKNFEARLGMGFGLTGFWFGLNGAYGLEQKPKE